MSIYDFQYVDTDEYYGSLRGQVERDFGKGYRRVGEDYQYSQTKLDYGISDLREDTSTGKERLTEDRDITVQRAGEDLKITRGDLNRALARTAYETMRRYVRRAPAQPTQVGLQALATRYAAINDQKSKEKAQLGHDRRVFDANLFHDRGQFDLDRRLDRGERDYGLESSRNSTLRDRGYEDVSDNRDDRLLSLNYTESNEVDALYDSYDNYRHRLGTPFQSSFGSQGQPNDPYRHLYPGGYYE